MSYAIPDREKRDGFGITEDSPADDWGSFLGGIACEQLVIGNYQWFQITACFVEMVCVDKRLLGIGEWNQNISPYVKFIMHWDDAHWYICKILTYLLRLASKTTCFLSQAAGSFNYVVDLEQGHLNSPTAWPLFGGSPSKVDFAVPAVELRVQR